MGKIIEKVKYRSPFNNKEIELEAVIDTGATLSSLPADVVKELDLKKLREVEVKYADNRIEKRNVCGGVFIKIKEREGIFEVIEEKKGTQPLIGQVVLESLDLVVNPKERVITPNPESPEIPRLELI